MNRPIHPPAQRQATGRQAGTLLLATRDPQTRALLRFVPERLHISITDCADGVRGWKLLRKASSERLVLVGDVDQLGGTLGGLCARSVWDENFHAIGLCDVDPDAAVMTRLRESGGTLLEKPIGLPGSMGAIDRALEGKKLLPISALPSPGGGDPSRQKAPIDVRTAPDYDPRSAGRLRVLAVSDYDGLRMAREQVLRKHGFQVVSVTSNDLVDFRWGKQADVVILCQSVEPHRAEHITELLRHLNPRIRVIRIQPSRGDHDLNGFDYQLDAFAGPGVLLRMLDRLLPSSEMNNEV